MYLFYYIYLYVISSSAFTNLIFSVPVPVSIFLKNFMTLVSRLNQIIKFALVRRSFNHTFLNVFLSVDVIYYMRNFVYAS